MEGHLSGGMEISFPKNWSRRKTEVWDKSLNLSLHQETAFCGPPYGALAQSGALNQLGFLEFFWVLSFFFGPTPAHVQPESSRGQGIAASSTPLFFFQVQANLLSFSSSSQSVCIPQPGVPNANVAWLRGDHNESCLVVVSLPCCLSVCRGLFAEIWAEAVLSGKSPGSYRR